MSDKVYTTKELVDTIIGMYDWVQENYDLDEEVKDKMDIAVRWLNSKVPENISPMPAADYEALPSDIKEEITRGVAQLRSLFSKPYLFKRHYATSLSHMYSCGVADGLGGEVVDEGQCFTIEKGKIYETTCPMCGERIGLDFSEFVKNNGGYGVRL